MQAITTRYLGPTNHRGSRVRAECKAGSVTLQWDDALDSDGNHRMAAEALLRKLGWKEPCYVRWFQGTLSDGRDVFVCEAQ